MPVNAAPLVDMLKESVVIRKYICLLAKLRLYLY